jgi:RNase P subunit RPR2
VEQAHGAGLHVSFFEELMKPAIETPTALSTDPDSKTVCCLRCQQNLQRYQLMRANLTPGTGHAILSCPRCGHVEFVVDSSPLLQNLELVTVDTGDGD